VSAELARHLLQSGTIAPEEVHAALLDVVTLGVPFVQALVSRGSQIGSDLEFELSRLRVPTLRTVRVARDLANRLPAGMCARLLAVPVGRASSGEVEVACADPLDPAIGVEFAQKLGAPVCIVRASLAQILGAIERWLDDPEGVEARVPRTEDLFYEPQGRMSAVGIDYALGRALRGLGDADAEVIEEVPADSSRAPVFPLVRRSLPAERMPTAPGLGEDEPPRSDSGLPVVVDPAVLDAATRPDEVVRRLAELAASLAKQVVVLALRGGAYEARASAPALSGEASALKVEAESFSVLAIAASEGHFLGVVPDDELHSQLRAVVRGDEVYVTPVVVSGKPTLTLVMAGLSASLDATRRADELARRAAAALERIVRERKRGG